ncbi:MAG: molybdopterin-dependent oxidoreductase, partial [Chromatiales bacterium]
MERQPDSSRRRFLKAGAIAGGGLLLGFYLPARPRLQAAEGPSASRFAPNAFIRIDPDDTVTIVVNKSEMGQGVYTSLPMLVAEELEADWERIRVESAPAHPDYNHTQWGTQVTGGSSSVNSSWEQLRTAGATAREMLIAAAAVTWGVAANACRAENGRVLHEASGRSLSFGALAAQAAEMPVPEAVLLKDPEEFNIIGKPVKRLDSPEKSRGTAVFGLDVSLPGMRTAVIARPPVFGATLKSHEAGPAEAVPGVEGVVVIPNGVAVVARDFWSAKKGRDALAIEWDLGPNAELSSEALRARYAEEAKEGGLLAQAVGDAERAFIAAEKVVSASYDLPYLAHAPMEPLNCVADVRADRCEIWTGTQLQTVDQQAAATIAGLSPG